MPVTLDMVWGELVVRHCVNDETVELAGPGALAAEIHDRS